MRIFINKNTYTNITESLEYFHVDDANPNQDEFSIGMEYSILENDIYNFYKDKIEIAKNKLYNLIKQGTVMYNIENNKNYLVYYNDELSRIIGKNVCICSVVNKNNEIHSTILVKPMDLFKKI